MSAAENDITAMKMIQESGVLNPKMPLDQMMALTERLATLPASGTGSAGTNATDTFIYHHFIYKHED